MKKILFFILFFCFFIGFSQEDIFKGNVFSLDTQLPLENVNVVNINQVKGTITNFKGDFAIKASVNDTLHLSLLGHKSVKVRVTGDMLKYQGTKIGLSQLAYALDEVVVTPYKLTGYLDIDAKYLPVNTNTQYNIKGVNKGYEAMVGTMNTNTGISIPLLGTLNKLFNSHQKDLKKLKKMKEENALMDLLHSKFDREMISEITGIKKEDIYEILNYCNYSEQFLKQANDIQILEALTQCYEEYNLTKNRK